MFKKIGLAVLLGALSLGVVSGTAEARGFGHGGGRGGGHGAVVRGGGGFRGGPVRRDVHRWGWERPALPYGYGW